MFNLGAVFRLLGPLIQIGGLTVLVRARKGDTLLGLPVDRAVWGAFLVGFALSTVGVILTRRRPKPDSDPIDRPLNLG